LEETNQLLKQLFEAHGLSATIQGDWLLFQEECIKVNGEIMGERRQKQGLIIQLDIRVQVQDKTIIESFAGMGDSIEKALENGLQNFAANSLHVFIGAFFDPKDARVIKELWSIGGQKRPVIIGQLGIRGKVPTENNVHLAWFKHFEAKIKETQLTEGLHWVRLYYAQMNERQMACEILLDNEPWKHMQKEMAGIDWPKSQDFYSLRIFLILLEASTSD
jgi:hypothetical protein